ncbi:MAG TPA: hypothetical protein VLM89_03155 [Phycisphaerae bacterium]|nr:hypothetical protein [Phycisphaerae bacterium]
MVESQDKTQGCGHCGMHGLCSMTPDDAGNSCDSPQSTEGIASASMVVFVLPLAAGIMGAYAAGRWFAAETAGSLACWQAVGLIAGAAVGILSARLLIPLRRPRGGLPGGGAE